MGLEFYYRDNDGTLTGPVTLLADDHVRLLSTSVTLNAEEGSVGSSRLVIDDLEGAVDIPGLRYFAIKETAVPASSNSFIFAGYTTDRKYSRGGNEGFRVGTSRKIDIGLVDANHILETRIMHGPGNNRPAETDVQRLTWLLSTAEGQLITDTRYFSTANPEDMDAVDYRWQSFKQIIDDCAQQSGKNYFLTYFGDTATANQPWGGWSLWYGASGLSTYTSGIRLSNLAAEVDSSTIFAISQTETTLTRDPSRVASGAVVPYDGGTSYGQLASTFNNFEKRDLTFPAQNVKTATKANRRGNRYLGDLDTEEDIITTEFIVPREQVNDLREGMLVAVRATHLPGYDSFTYLRVLNRTVTENSEATFNIRVELAATGIEPSNVGDTIGGYLCTEDGYQVPTDPGPALEPMEANGPSNSYTDSPAGNNSQPLNYGRCQLYGGATYGYTYHLDHGATNCAVTMRIASIGGGTLVGDENMGSMCPCPPGLAVPRRTDASGSFTLGGTPGSPTYYELINFHTNYAGCSAGGIVGTAVLTYISGPDPRFENLPGCPIP